MKKNLPKSFLLAFSILLFSSAYSQNWQYHGAPYINGTTGSGTYLYYPDLEINAGGDVFVGYWEYSGQLHFAKCISGTWSQLPTIGTFTANTVDIEVQGSNYYFAYARVRGSNMYAYVQKFNGSNWVQVGDSLLLGNSGSGGYFDFLLDNAGVPTVLGVVNSVSLANKQVVQFNGSAWTSIHTFTNSAATIFRENSGVFNSMNKLYCATEGYYLTSSLKYFTVVNKVDGGVRSTVGDTIWRQLSGHKVKVDGSDVPYLFSYNPISAKVYPFKLNGSLWNFIGDTTSASVGSPLAAELANNGNFVFNVLASNPYKSMYYINSGARAMMDTLNINGVSVANISDFVVTPSNGNVYVAFIEGKAGAVQEICVMKHGAPGTIGIKEFSYSDPDLLIYPNPTQDKFTILKKGGEELLSVKIYNMTGELIEEKEIFSTTETIDLSSRPKGIYLVKIFKSTAVYTMRIVVD
jgi:hypothetical protein